MSRNKKSKEVALKGRKKAIIGLTIATSILGATTLGLSIAYATTQAYSTSYETQLENVYQKNLYDLVESINNAETKLSKILVSSDVDYQNKMLVEVSHNTDLAQQSISSLPISQGGFSESVRFINQVGGYTTTLAKKLSKGEKISKEEEDTLSEIRQSLAGMKQEVNKFIENKESFSILQESQDLKDNTNSFTIRISKIKDDALDYPTMIYDGPFSDSETNIEIKGLSGDEVTKEVAQNEVLKCFKDVADIEYQGEINSRIETYNFKVSTTYENTLYAQVTKIGGHIITVSGMANEINLSSVDLDEAEKIAINFAKENGIEDATCVWRDVLKNDGYFNIAPKQSGVILYPDLVKVKIDLSTGTVIGYDASTYFTNHTNRLIPKSSIAVADAKKALPGEYNFQEGRLVLAPLEYSREVLCYEFIGEKDGETYYFYINAQTGKEENVLKVIETTDGSKLM